MRAAGKYISILFLSFLFLSANENNNNLHPSKASPPMPSQENISEIIFDEAEKNNKDLSETAGRKHGFSDLRYSPNYFNIDESGETLWNGKFWPVEYYPLKIYIEKCHSSYYKKKFEKYVDYALQLWNAADNRLKFGYVDYPDQADVIIVFAENLMEKYNQNFMGLTEYELYDDKSIRLSLVQISLLNFDNQRIKDGEIKATIIHEIGHALGLGHSENSIDIMFPFIDPASGVEMKFTELSRGDVAAVRSIIKLGEKEPLSTSAEPSF